MVLSSAKNLQGYIEELLGAHQLLECFQKAKHFCAVIGIDGSMPLRIERYGDMVVVTQYPGADGFLLTSPEIICRVSERGQWLPIEARVSLEKWHNCASGSWLSNLRERFYIRRFSARWLKRLAPQMYERGEVLELWGENE